MTEKKIRIPARAQEFLRGSQVTVNIERGELKLDRPETVHMFQAVFAAERGKDGSVRVELDADDRDELFEWMTYLADASGDNAGGGDMDALADLNAARAVMRAIEKARQPDELEPKHREALEVLVRLTDADPTACLQAGTQLYSVEYGSTTPIRNEDTYPFSTLKAMENRGLVTLSYRRESLIHTSGKPYRIARLTDKGRAAIENRGTDKSPNQTAKKGQAAAMKVNINITVEFDPAKWTTAFGIEGAAEIREDVKEYIGNEISGAGVFGNGEVPLKSVSWK